MHVIATVRAGLLMIPTPKRPPRKPSPSSTAAAGPPCPARGNHRCCVCGCPVSWTRPSPAPPNKPGFPVPIGSAAHSPKPPAKPAEPHRPSPAADAPFAHHARWMRADGGSWPTSFSISAKVIGGRCPAENPQGGSKHGRHRDVRPVPRADERVPGVWCRAGDLAAGGPAAHVTSGGCAMQSPVVDTGA